MILKWKRMLPLTVILSFIAVTIASAERVSNGGSAVRQGATRHGARSIAAGPRDTVPKDTLPKDTVRRDSLSRDSVSRDTLRTPSDTVAVPRDTILLRGDSANRAALRAQQGAVASSSDTGMRGSDQDSAALIQSLVLVTSEALDQMRTRQLSEGVAPGKSLLLRSATSLTPPPSTTNRLFGAAVIAPQVLVVRNSAIPFSQNNSALWAGRGFSSRTLVGLRLAIPHVDVVFAPQLIASQNQQWQLRGNYYQPDLPPGYQGQGYAFPFYFYTYPVDQPLSYGPNSIRKFDWGESTVSVAASVLQAGLSNENEWWGPGLRNALILSNNAPGFPHAFLRTTRPIGTPLGGIELRWLVGQLNESQYFDTLSGNNYRSLAAIAATVQTRWNPNLSLGVARSVYATMSSRRDIASRWADVFRSTTERDSLILRQIWTGKQIPPGRDQLFSMFARWVFPASGAEVYGEWGRTEFPASLSDFLKAPNHTQAYTVGGQWRGGAWARGSIRLQGEITQAERSATFRTRVVESWYTSSRVIQGYTNEGQVIGASIGPGAESQFVAADYMKPSWRVGIFAGRVRWNEDVHNTYGFPDYVAYCNYDVTLSPGVRGAASNRFGNISAEYSFQNRLNMFFQNSGGCPNNGQRLDVRNGSFMLKFEPFSYR